MIKNSVIWILMNRTIFTIAFLLLMNFCKAQTLQTGVYTYDTLLTLNVSSVVADSTCPLVFLNFDDCEPYVTGMNVFLRIDSVVGPVNAVKFQSYSGFLQPGDTFPVSAYTNYNVVYYHPLTFYISLIAAGTPLIPGEAYYCEFDYQTGIIVDGCGGWFYTIQPQIASQNCFVDSVPAGISANSEPEDIFLYPDPVTDKFIIVLTGDQEMNLSILNISGELLFQRRLINRKNAIDVGYLPKGIYLIKVESRDQSLVKKMIIN